MDLSFYIFLLTVLAVIAVIALALQWGWLKWCIRRHVRRHERLWERGIAAFEAADYKTALTAFRAIVDCPLCAKPDETGLAMIGLSLQLQGDHKAALAAYEQAHESAPDSSMAINLLALLLATAPHEELRDGHRARSLAIRACNSSKNRDWEALTILAAAEAELGHFDEAVTVYEEAMSLMPDEERAKRHESLDRLRNGVPFRCSPDLDRRRLCG